MTTPPQMLGLPKLCARNQIRFEVNSHWEPFQVGNEPYKFDPQGLPHLKKDHCSHTGPAIYKWQGPITNGPKKGLTGVLVGEAADLHQRINQYKTGTQKNGNKKWREEFLCCGDIFLHILKINSASYDGKVICIDLMSGCWRQVIEQLLVKDISLSSFESMWIVNCRQ